MAAASGPLLGSLDELLANTAPDTRDLGRPWLLSPIDLQVVKAAGVTFPISMLERIIEERARGEMDAALGIRAEITEALGGELDTLVPGSPEAARVKEALIERGLWSQYLEVGIGPDAEVFTKAPGAGVGRLRRGVGVRSRFAVEQPRAGDRARRLVARRRGRRHARQRRQSARHRGPLGAAARPRRRTTTPRAALGPFVRLFDASYGLEDVRTAVVTLEVEGDDGF